MVHNAEPHPQSNLKNSPHFRLPLIGKRCTGDDVVVTHTITHMITS